MSAAVTNIAGGDEFERLYRAWRYAKAQWDLAENDPSRDELSSDEAAALCSAEHQALVAWLLHHAETAAQLARKLRVFHEMECWDLGCVEEVTAQLVKDARLIAFEPRRLRKLAKSPGEG